METIIYKDLYDKEYFHIGVRHMNKDNEYIIIWFSLIIDEIIECFNISDNNKYRLVNLKSGEMLKVNLSFKS